MKEQAGTQTLDNGDVSELQMVGQLLFGSLPDASAEASGEAPRMINLGAKIAPESAREWFDEESELEPMLLPEEIPASAESVPAKPKRNLRSYASAICMTLIITTFCGILFVAGMMVNEKQEAPEVKEVAAETPVKTSVPAVMVPSNPSDSFAEREIPEFAQMDQPVESFGAPSLASSSLNVPTPDMTEDEDDLPVYNASMVSTSPVQPTFAPVNSAVGANAQYMNGMVMTAPEEEDYPTFNANVGMVPQAAAGLEIAANNDAVPTYNAGSTMDEIPVYNSYAGTQMVGNQASAASYAPAVGSQVPASAPRKLAPPAATHAPAPVYEEPVPSFNPGLGTDSIALPVTYQ